MNDAPLAIIDKRRAAHNIAESLTVIGEVKGKTAILIDDMIDTGGTICSGARLLKREKLFAGAEFQIVTTAMKYCPDSVPKDVVKKVKKVLKENKK